MIALVKMGSLGIFLNIQFFMLRLTSVQILLLEGSPFQFPGNKSVLQTNSARNQLGLDF
jgi:hypothetical protein